MISDSHTAYGSALARPRARHGSARRFARLLSESWGNLDRASVLSYMGELSALAAERIGSVENTCRTP